MMVASMLGRQASGIARPPMDLGSDKVQKPSVAVCGLARASWMDSTSRLSLSLCGTDVVWEGLNRKGGIRCHAAAGSSSQGGAEFGPDAAAPPASDGSTGHIPLKSMDKRRQLECLKTCMRLVKEGVSVLFFPEGTRTTDGAMAAFKKGAFSVASKGDRASCAYHINWISWRREFSESKMLWLKLTHHGCASAAIIMSQVKSNSGIAHESSKYSKSINVGQTALKLFL